MLPQCLQTNYRKLWPQRATGMGRALALEWGEGTVALAVRGSEVFGGGGGKSTEITGVRH